MRSREEIEERLETEDRQQLGDISDEVYPRDTPTSKFHLRVPWICTRTVCVCVYARALSCRRPPPPPPPSRREKVGQKASLEFPRFIPRYSRVHYRSLSVSLCLFLCLSWKAALPFLFPGRAAKISSCFRPRPTLDDLCLPFVASVKKFTNDHGFFQSVSRGEAFSREVEKCVWENTLVNIIGKFYGWRV